MLAMFLVVIFKNPPTCIHSSGHKPASFIYIYMNEGYYIMGIYIIYIYTHFVSWKGSPGMAATLYLYVAKKVPA